MSYEASNVFEHDEVFTFRCYVCNQFLGDGLLTRDHIIPQTLYHNEKTARPILKIHPDCNSTVKSAEDDWFSKIMYFRCQDNAVIARRMSRLIESASIALADQSKATRSEHRSNFILRKLMEGWTLVPDSSSHAKAKRVTMRPTAIAITREQEYIRGMARGLLTRNTWFADIEVGDVMTFQFNTLKSSGLYGGFLRDVRPLFVGVADPVIYQKWDEDILYVINPKIGMVYFEFYGQLAYTVQFAVSFPSISAKASATDKMIAEAENFLLSKMKIWERA